MKVISSARATEKLPSRTTLSKREQEGALVRIMPGFYVEKGITLTTENLMQWISKKQPAAVLNLISALSFHGVTTQIPEYLSIALPRGVHMPHVYVAPIRVWYTSPKLAQANLQEEHGQYGTFRVTTLERTLVDCFKHRHKLGLGIFLEALQLATPQLNVWQLQKQAADSRVLNGMLPYLRSILNK